MYLHQKVTSGSTSQTLCTEGQSSSSPGSTPSAQIALCNAVVAELADMLNLVEKKVENSSSKD